LFLRLIEKDECKKIYKILNLVEKKETEENYFIKYLLIQIKNMRGEINANKKKRKKMVF